MLLNRPAPRTNEILPHYLFRLTRDNGFHNIQALLRAVNIPISNSRIPLKKIYFGELKLDLLSSAVNLKPSVFSENILKRASRCRFLFNRQCFMLKSISFNHLRICQKCYSDNPELSLLNSIHAKTVCTRHNIPLIESYAATGQKLSLNMPLLVHETVSIQRKQTRVITNDEYSFNQCIERLWHDKRNTPFRVKLELTLADFLDLTTHITRFHNLAFGNISSKNSTGYFKPIFRYVSKWPKPYLELLNHFQRHPISSKGLTGIRKCYRDLYDDLYTKQNSQSLGYQLLRQQFEVFISKYFSHGVISNSIKTLTPPQLKNLVFLSETQACQYLSIPITKLRLLIREGLIAPSKVMKNKRHLFRVEELDSLRTLLQSCVTLNEASELLGISKYLVRSLLEHKVIFSKLLPTKENRDWLIDKNELENLVKTLKTNSTKKASSGAKSIKRHFFAGKQYAMILKKMLSAEIKYFYCRSSESPLSLRQFEVEYDDSNENPKELMTPISACKLLGVNKNALYDLVSRGLIKSVKTKVKRTARPVTLIPPESIEEFKLKYLLRWQARGIPKNELVLLSGPTVDKGVINIYQNIHFNIK